MHAVTICARNYLSRARVLAKTYLRHNPDDRFTIFLVDAEPGEVAPGSGYEISGPHRLNMDPHDFQRMAIIYDITELCTSLKPWVLESLLARARSRSCTSIPTSPCTPRSRRSTSSRANTESC